MDGSERLEGGVPSSGVPEENLRSTLAAPLKPSFLRRHVASLQHESADPPPRDAVAIAGEHYKSSSNSDGQKLQHGKQARGRNKKRPRDSNDDTLKICHATLQGSVCSYGERCKWNHDLAGYMKHREKDLGDMCVLFNKYGFCRFGATCRFGSSHVHPETGVNIQRPETEGGVLPEDPAINDLSTEARILLRKGQYSFVFPRRGRVPLKSSRARVAVPSVEVHVNESGCGAEAVSLCAVAEAVDADAPFLEQAAEAEGEISVGGGCDAEASIADFDTPANTLVVEPLAAVAGAAAVPVLASQAACSEGENMRTAAASDTKASVTLAASAGGKSNPLLREKKPISFDGKVWIAPLTTVGNLPFRRCMKRLGADITCGEMAMAENLLQGQASEWALLRRHKEEDIFGVQLAGAYTDQLVRTCELVEAHCDVDFVDLNSGCPIDLVCDRGAGSALMTKPSRLEEIVAGMTATLRVPLVVKVRTGWDDKKRTAHNLLPLLRPYACASLPLVWDVAASQARYTYGGVDAPPASESAARRLSIGAGVGAFTVHGRSRLQRYSRLADWDYIGQVVRTQADETAGALPMLPIIGNGDVCSWSEWEERRRTTGVATCLLARGALIKPWLATEIKERREWDISSRERLDILRDFVHFGLEHWGSDQKGVNTTRRFLLEWLSFLHRYIPVGLMERLPFRMNQRPDPYVGRDDLETLMASPVCSDWVKISELLLGRVPEGFEFLPKHKANSFEGGSHGRGAGVGRELGIVEHFSAGVESTATVAEGLLRGAAADSTVDAYGEGGNELTQDGDNSDVQG